MKKTSERKPLRSTSFTPKKILRTTLLSLAALLIIINLLPEKRIYLNSQEYEQTEKATFYVFKNEEYRLIDSDTPITFSLDEAEKAGANSDLAKGCTADLSDITLLKLKAIDYLIENKNSLENKADVYALILHVKTQLTVIDEKLTAAMKSKDEQAKKTLSEQREEKQSEYEILKTALNYVHLSKDSLYNTKYELEQLYLQGKVPVTPYNLNFSFYGNIYYSIDGYEDIMTFDSLDNLNNSYFDDIDKLTYSYKPSETEYCIKNVATDKIIVCAKVAASVYIDAEYDATAITEGLYTEYDMSEGFYNFLYAHIGLLNTYPDIRFTDSNSNVVSGKLLNTVYDGNYKYLVICVRDNYSYFMSKRIFKADLITEDYYCFIIPSSCVYSSNGSDYITAVYSVNQRKAVGVVVYKRSSSKLYLKTAQNPELFQYKEILYRGDKNDQ